MKNPRWLFETLLTRWRVSSDLKYLEKLERENLEDVRAGRNHKASNEKVGDIKSRYQYDMLHGDETSNNMMVN